MLQGIAENISMVVVVVALLTNQTGFFFFPKITQKEEVLLNYVHDLTSIAAKTGECVEVVYHQEHFPVA